MDTDGRMAINTSDLLTLMQWLSPSYPVGGFAYSHGFEDAIQQGYVTDAKSLLNWTRDTLEHGSGRNDALFLAAAYKATPEQLLDIDAACRAFASSAERLKETDLQGAAFCKITKSIWDLEYDNLTLPVAVGHAAALRQLPLETVIAAFLHGFVSNISAVGMRLIPLGQTEGQKVIHDLHSVSESIAKDTSHGDLSDLHSSAFMSDISSMNHETQYSRIFRT